MALDLFAKATRYSGLSALDIRRIVLSGPRRYKTYPILKRSGGKRIIAQPARELKDLQYFLMNVLLSKLPLHQAATAYHKGASIRINAERHVNSYAILKMDFRDFFGSIRPKDFDALCVDNTISLSKDDQLFSHNVLFWQERGSPELKLSIGAPSSPILSNAVMYLFDTQIDQISKALDVAYTRYADDMTFSGSNVEKLVAIRDKIPTLLKNLPYPLVYLNPDKTILVTKRHRRTVTGLVLSNDGLVSLGRSRKRKIRAGVHSCLNGLLNVEQVESLRGELAFANSVEPNFIQRLRKHYGDAGIDSILKRRFRPRTL